MPQSPPKNIHDFAVILARIEFQNWKFFVDMDGDRCYLQLRFQQPCTKGTHQRSWTGRKWLLSPYMTDSEVVTTAFKAVITATEHETRELFKYKGKAIFGPHIDVEELYAIADKEDVRGEVTQ